MQTFHLCVVRVAYGASAKSDGRQMRLQTNVFDGYECNRLKRKENVITIDQMRTQGK